MTKQENSYIEYLKLMGLIDVVILAMIEMKFPMVEIAEKTTVSRQTVYDVKNRQIAIKKFIGGK